MRTCSSLWGSVYRLPLKLEFPEVVSPLVWRNQPGYSGRAAAPLHYCILSPVPLPHGPALKNSGEAEQGGTQGDACL